ncbi:amidohydrolase family protein [Catellatospora coxensis]
MEQFHPEYGPGQLEVSVAHADPVTAADRVVLVRETIRALAFRHGLRASFAPVAVAEQVGNGMHLHFSVWAGGVNLFAGGDGPYGMTRRGESVLAGVLQRLPALAGLGAPSPASALRQAPQRWAGAYQCWGHENREAALRFVTGASGGRDTAANAEIKCVDASANPYLVAGAVCALATDAAGAGMRLPDEVRVDPFTLAEARRPPRLPDSPRWRPSACAPTRAWSRCSASRCSTRSARCTAPRPTPSAGSARPTWWRRCDGGTDRGPAADRRALPCDHHGSAGRRGVRAVVHGGGRAGRARHVLPGQQGGSGAAALVRAGAGPARARPGRGLPAAAAPLGPDEVATRLLRAANLSALLVDTGPVAGGLVDRHVLGTLAGASTHAVVRLELLAERVAPGTDAAGFAAAFAEALDEARPGAVATKSIAAYRHGLDLDPARPEPHEVSAAASRWQRDGGRLTDPVLLRHLLWSAVDAGLPVQLHTGFGDRDAALARADPALLQPFCAATLPFGVPLVLLHCYPYHRQAGWLAQVYPHVHADLGLTVPHLGARATAVLGEFLELAPFGKLLYSSDAYGLPELYVIAAAQLRHSLGLVLAEAVDDGAASAADARRIAEQIGAGNAARVYRLD